MRVKAVIVGVLAAVLLGACGSDSDDGNEPDGPKTPRAVLQLRGGSGEVPFDSPVQFSVRGGAISSVEVVPEDGEPVAGQVGEDGTTWRSDDLLAPGGAYDVTVVADDRFGEEHTLESAFTVTNVPDANRLTLGMLLDDGAVVGVGAPIVIMFDQEVTDREAVERAMHVASSPQVVGSWHWVNSTEVHFRPEEYWPAGTQVQVDLRLNGVKAGDNLWGGRSYDLTFEIGSAQIAQVDAATHQMTMVVDGQPVTTWNTSLGAPEFATRNGTYIMLEKFETRQMTSCNAGITCDPGNSEYYDLAVDWAVRLSNSGTFIHAAPWSEGSQGTANVSHGCINLSEADGQAYFAMTRYGDVVTVTNSTRPATDLVERGDPGMVDWNMSWDQYVAGSALGAAITTDPLE